MARQPLSTRPNQADSTLALSSLHLGLGLPFNDYSANAKNGTASGGVVTLPNHGASLDGTDDKIDYGDIGNILEVSMWVNPGSTTEQIVLVDTGKYISLVAGTVTYTGLTATATYVDSVAGTTMIASKWQHLVCQFQVTDANNFELGTDGSNFGDVDVYDLRAHTVVSTSDQVKTEFRKGVPDSSLVLSMQGDVTDESVYRRACTPSGGIICGSWYTLDGTDDKLDAGDIGNIVEISAWVKPATTSQELFLIDTGKHIKLSAGTVTYTGLTASATYVNGVASTTMIAGAWQYLVCQFTQVDANNMELGNDGTNYGQFDCNDWQARTSARSVAAVKLHYDRTRGNY